MIKYLKHFPQQSFIDTSANSLENLDDKSFQGVVLMGFL
jgi:hypothetical protein